MLPLQVFASGGLSVLVLVVAALVSPAPGGSTSYSRWPASIFPTWNGDIPDLERAMQVQDEHTTRSLRMELLSSHPISRRAKAMLRWVLFGAGWLGLAGLLGLLGAEAPKEGNKSPSSLPPLKVDRSKAPRLEEAAGVPPAGPSFKNRADNSACYVCHANYDGEGLVQVHAAARVGCIDCHGQSLAHRNDESHLTPPDKMYPAEAIDRACQACHDTHDVPAKKVLARWQDKCPQKTDPSQLVCTDCHGDHRLSGREIRWDKRTGKLLSSANAPSPQPNQ